MRTANELFNLALAFLMASPRPFYAVVPVVCGSSWDPRLQVVPLEAYPKPGHPPIFRELPEVQSGGRGEHSSAPDYDNA
eukprot:7193045-Pyramimonas_sp.AAC.1